MPSAQQPEYREDLARLLTLISRYATACADDMDDAIAARELVRAEVLRWHAVIEAARSLFYENGRGGPELAAAFEALDTASPTGP